MKLVSLVIFLLFLRPAQPQEPLKLFSVSGTISLTEDYCGGAEPDAETLQWLGKPHPYAGAVILFRRGSHNEMRNPIAARAVTDAMGRYEVKLPAGEYCVIREYQQDETVFEQVKKWPSESLQADEVCLLEKWTLCVRSLNVQTNVTSFDFEFHKSCFLPEGIPCLDYTGPYPP